MDTRQYYDTESGQYDGRRWESASGKARDEWQYHALVKLLGDVTHDNVLEIGCGTGRMTLRLLPQCQQLIAVDFSKRMLESLAKKKSIESESRLRLILTDACKLPLPDNNIDVAFFVNTIQLIESPEKLFKEIQRILKPGGRLIFNYPNLMSVYLPYGLYRNWTGRTRTKNESGYRRTRWFSRYWLQKILKENGLHVVESVGQPGMNPGPSISTWYPEFCCPSVFLNAEKNQSKV